ncbi:phage holin family protein [Frankia sp. AiPs1]|uniref:phage holin family protein n=1 Tax=Frankia sp. AiPs1 TaxID=573493 RepID=UPI0020442069|nr:phage holin family protein [Frankia sp. AiPs1]MCM3923638.1 phage holin family protein [Frankia sp. AiPs1]
MTSTYRQQPDVTDDPYPNDVTAYRGAVDVAAPDDSTQVLRAPAAATSTVSPSSNSPLATDGRPASGGHPTARHDGEGHSTGRGSTGQLVSEVVTDISTLFRQEVALAKAEVREEAKKAGKGAGMFAGAGGAGYFALLFALLAVMFGLGEVMALGWAALIVTVVLGAVAAVLALKGRSTVRKVHPAPTQTVETLREDVQWAQSRRK